MNKFLAFFILVALCAAVSLVFLSGPDVAVESTPLTSAHAEDSSRDDALHTANADLDSAPQMTRDDAIETHNTLAANQEAWASSTAELAYIKFRVVNEDGQPLPQCLVSLASKNEARYFTPAASSSSSETKPTDYALNSQGEIILAIEANDDDYYSVHHPNWQGKTFKCQGLGAGEINDLGDITLSPAAAISGTILNSSGQPVKSASVQLIVITSLWQGRQMKGTQETDADGTYLFSGMGADDYILEVMAPAYLKATKTLKIDTLPATESVDFVLADGELIQGRVLNSDGRPIADAGIYQLFSSSADQPFNSSTNQPEDDDEALTHSDINGAFSMVVGFDKGLASIGAQHSSYTWQTLDIENDGSLVSFTLQPSLSLSGKLTHYAGLDFKVSFINLGRIITTGGWERLESFAVSEIDADGRFSLSDFPPGTYTLKVDTNLGDLIIDALEILTSMEDYEVNLPLTPRIEVTVLDDSGAPVENAYVIMRAIQQKVYSRNSLNLSCYSDANGQCVLGGMPFEEYTIDVLHDGFILPQETYSVWQDVQQLQVVLQRTANLHIKVTNPEGDAAKGISVKVKRDGEILSYGKTDDFGAISFPKLSEGEVGAYFDTGNDRDILGFTTIRNGIPQEKEKEEEGQLGHTVVTLVAGDTTQLDWVVAGLASLEATITNNGQPAEGFSVALVEIDDTTASRTRSISFWSGNNEQGEDKTNAKGLVVLEDVKIGEYTLRVNLGRMSLPIEQLITLNAGYNTVRIDLALNSISGRLIEVSGAAAANNRLSLIKASDRESGAMYRTTTDDSGEIIGYSYAGTAVVTSDSAGYFTFVGVPDGDWIVLAHKKSFIPAKSDPVQISGGSELDIGSIELQLSSRIYGFNARHEIRDPQSQNYNWDQKSHVRVQQLNGVDGNFSTSMWCDIDNGEYSFDALEPGTYQVSNGEWLSDEIVLVRGAEARVNIPLLDE